MRLLVPYDGSDLSERALAYATDTHPDAGIDLLYVLDIVEAGYDVSPEGEVMAASHDWYDEAESRAEQLLADARGLVDDPDRVSTEIVVGRPARSIVEYAENHDVDAIVMGSHGRDGLSRIFLGSVAETVVRRAPVPVTIVR